MSPTLQERLRWSAALLLANAGFGLAASTVGGMRVNGLAAMSIAYVAAGAACLLYLLATGRLETRLRPRALAWLGVYNVLQGGLYFAGLQLAPAGPVAALHLCSPLVLLALAVSRRERRFGPREALVGLLVVGGGVLATRGGAGGGGGSPQVLGYGLALASAFLVAALYRAVAALGKDAPVLSYLGVQYLAGGLVTLPCLAFGAPPDAGEALRLVAIGAALYFPGNLAVFFALGRLTPVAVGAMSLFEAVFAALFAAMLYARPTHPGQLLAIALIVGAALAEVTRPAPAARPTDV